MPSIHAHQEGGGMDDRARKFLGMQVSGKRHADGTPIRAPTGSAYVTIDVPLNDDEAEKRHRRRSAREETNRRRSLLASPMRAGAHGLDGGQSGTTSPGTARRDSGRKRLDVVATAPRLQVPLISSEQMYNNYEEWMKMATDNKINAANSWNFALIDYFHEMTFLRDGDSINFQKASCTLDGCVKIYISRVDSVASETGKLLSGLADSAVDGADREEDDEGEIERRQRRKANRTENTIAKDFSSIIAKKLDLEFSVDPLFKKTSADFDEGGARGLLLNHLAVDRDCRIIFDAGDARDADEDDLEDVGDEEGTAGEDEGQAAEKKWRQRGIMKPSDYKPVSIESLRDKFMPSLQNLNNQTICPSLKSFEFTMDGNVDLDWIRSDEELGRYRPVGTQAATLDALDNNVDGGMESEIEQLPFDDIPETGIDMMMDDNNPFDPKQANDGMESGEDDYDEGREGDYLMAMATGESGMFSYFDTAFKKNWAGPEHWKLKRAVRKLPRKDEEATEGLDEGEGGQEKRKRKTKEPFTIDFINGEDVDEKVLFAKATKSSITMPLSRDKNNRHLLPDDMQFSSKQLLRFFLKPKFTIMSRRKGLEVAGDNEPDEGFWAQQNPDADGEDTYGDTPYDGMDVGDPGALGFDDDDDDVMDGIGESFGDQTLSQPLKFVQADYINYAKTAKKVDVKKLKDNLWQQMVSSGDKSSNRQASPDVDKLPKEQTFSSVMNGLKDLYPADKRKDISVSFGFICLLHLANERGLSIESADDIDLSELVIRQDNVDGGNSV
ncbi:hypothetical protein BZG36_04291 [Bifiguratus adelaidae]|uniref:Condensin complex subunit 2 n=1 Tax=Bifiguratus adelaidae TaxID=1938954 RepID=A0A261XVG6_9FUNG|nr:hypothetical protein BZG36_04291 [Bifiguratus adelaidae]